MTNTDIEARLHAALDELGTAVPLRHADRPRADAAERSSPDPLRVSSGGAFDDHGEGSDTGRPTWADPKLLSVGACILVLLVALGVVGLSHALRHHPAGKVSTTSTSIPSVVTTPPPTPSSTVPPAPTTTVAPSSSTAVPPNPSLPISVQSDAQMQAAGNTGPTSSVLVPTSCVLSGTTVTATGTYQGGFAPNVYNRYGDVVELYVYGEPSTGYPQGAQLGASPVASSPAMGSGTWQVSTTVDVATGPPASCVVAAQPTHAIQLAP